MNEFQSLTVMTALFALRCVAPLVLMFAIGFLMNRLVDRWESEDKARQDSAVMLADRGTPVMSIAPVKIPCWILRDCDPAKRANCPAYHNPAVPCWLARSSTEGKLPAGCSDCSAYAVAPVVAH